MKLIITIFTLLLISYGGICQTNTTSSEEVPDKASPFTLVDRDNDETLIQFEGEWYGFIAQDTLSKDRRINFCKSEHGDKWQKRFSEDLAEILREMNNNLKKEVALKLEMDGEIVNKVGIPSFDNRQSVRKYKAAKSEKIPAPKKISRQNALKDLEQLQALLEANVSYLNRFDYRRWITNINASPAISILIQSFDSPFKNSLVKRAIGIQV